MNLFTALLFQILTLGPLAPFNFDAVGHDSFRVVEHLPAEGTVTSAFGKRHHPLLGLTRHHDGVDIASHHGAVIYSVSPGRVQRVSRSGGYGLMVVINHGNGWMSRYAHMSHTHLRTGDYLWSGAIIGRMGATGIATGPHVHFELRYRGQAIDPMPYLAALYSKTTPILAQNDEF